MMKDPKDMTAAECSTEMRENGWSFDTEHRAHSDAVATPFWKNRDCTVTFPMQTTDDDLTQYHRKAVEYMRYQEYMRQSKEGK